MTLKGGKVVVMLTDFCFLQRAGDGHLGLWIRGEEKARQVGWDQSGSRIPGDGGRVFQRLPGRRCGWWPLGTLCLVVTFRIFLLLSFLCDSLSFYNQCPCPHAEEKEERHWSDTEVVVRWLNACG